MTPPALTIEPDCLGRTRLAENQMGAIIQKIKAQGLLNQEPPSNLQGRGVVIAGGGKYLKHAWAVCRHLRKLGWSEGIQVWHLGPAEMPEESKPLFHDLDAETVDALELRKLRPMRRLGPWELKTYAVLHCPWRHVLFLDADCIPAINPAEMFHHEDIQKVGSLFFSDVEVHNKSSWGHTYCGLKKPEKEWEAGQWIVDKQRAWMGLRWSFWLLEHSEVWFKMGWGDKYTTELGFRMSGVPHLVSTDARWCGWGIGQFWRNKMWFRHCMAAKRGDAAWPQEFADALADYELVVNGSYIDSSDHGQHTASEVPCFVR